MRSEDARFVGSIPAFYDQHLGPVLFHGHAKDLASRLAVTPGMRVLEVACGTGIVTRQLLGRLPAEGQLAATDLNAPMLDHARGVLPDDPRLELRTADAQSLPFADFSFDAWVCQYGVMFFPDKLLAMREARRVLKPGGQLLFNVWRPLAENIFAHTVQRVMSERFPEDPPKFYAAPFSWGEADAILATLAEAGFRDARCEPLQRTVDAASPEHFARGLVLGNPLALELTERGVDDPEVLLNQVADALAAACGNDPCRVVMKTLVVTANT